MRFTQPLTKCSIRVETADGLEATLDRAVRTAMEGSPGPVFVDVSESALAGQAGHRDSASAAAAEPARDVRSPDPLAIADAARLLVQARRPVLLIGDAARWADCDAALHRLVEGFGLPFATTPMSRGVVPDDHPLCFNAARGRLLATADFVLAVGARFDWTVRFGTEIAADARIVHVVAQPEDVGAPPRGIELCGDVAGTLCMLLAVLDATAPRGLDVDRGWVDASVARRDAGRCNAVPPEEFGLTPMSPYEWLTEMRDALPREAITVLDGNVVMTAAQRLLPASRPWRRLTPGAAGVMGVGIPFAIGAKLARPDLPVVAIVGDFGFGLSGFELETAARHGVEIVAVVANNAGPGGATRQRAHFPNGHPERSGSYGTDIRHESIARSLGACGTRIDAPGQLGPALLEALAGAAPICLDVVTNEYTALSPSI
jgi:thiamine pyrophosphate-dependent acetolactate synthase large subunit-like protein